MGFERWHRELDVGAGFVEEVADHSAGEDVVRCVAASTDGIFDDFDAAVFFELLRARVSIIGSNGVGAHIDENLVEAIR